MILGGGGLTRVPVGSLHVSSLVDPAGDCTIQGKAYIIHVVCSAHTLKLV